MDFKAMIYELRCVLCEMFISWSLAIAPKGYIPSSIQATLNMLDRQKSAHPRS